MLRRRGWQFVCAALALVVASPASTEWFLDVYAGKAFMESTDVDIRPVDAPPSLGRIQADLQDVELDDFTSYGLRIGRWFEGLHDFGLAVDLFRFTPNVSTQIGDTPINIGGGVDREVRLRNVIDIPVIIAVSSLEVILRRPLLTSSAFPNGRLQPYISAGPALLLNTKPDVTLGVKAGAGLVWRLSERIALFGEYRFTHFRPTIETGGVNVAGVETGDLEVESDADTQYVLGGLSFQFGE
jgi:hypothetical protein